jgi:flavin-binding protein dodecin
MGTPTPLADFFNILLAKGDPPCPSHKVIELSCESTHSFEDAIKQGIEKASKTVRNIKGAWVKEQQVVVEGNKVMAYRVDLKITFVLE